MLFSFLDLFNAMEVWEKIVAGNMEFDYRPELYQLVSRLDSYILKDLILSKKRIILRFNRFIDNSTKELKYVRHKIDLFYNLIISICLYDM